MLVAMIAAAAVASVPAEPTSWAFRRPSAFAESAACKATGRYQTSWEPALLYRQGDRVQARRLEDLPKPDYEKAVVRTVEGCSAPLIVGVGVGR